MGDSQHTDNRQKLTGTEYGIVATVVLAWMYLLRWVWSEKVFDRFFGYAGDG